MKKNELLKLREQFLQEKQRRKRINELLETELIQEFIQLSGVKIKTLDCNDTSEILFSILKNFTIKQTNGIYVCTGTFYTSCHICYEETDYYSRETDFDSVNAEYREYCDIEDGSVVLAYMKPEYFTIWTKLLASDFEEKNIVLNPYNSSEDKNGYTEVREKFFMTAIEKGQGTAKKLILKQYPRM